MIMGNTELIEYCKRACLNEYSFVCKSFDVYEYRCNLYDTTFKKMKQCKEYTTDKKRTNYKGC